MPLDDDEYYEVSLLDVFEILWRKKFLLILVTALCAVGSWWYASRRPNVYRAVCTVLPPQGSGSLASQLGGLADFIGVSRSSASAGRMMLGIMTGDSVVDAIIEKFDLQKKYGLSNGSLLRLITRSGLNAALNNDSGLIEVAYVNTDPKFAAEMANAFVDELRIKLQEISAEDALQRKTFFENQLNQAQRELNAAEDALINYQLTRGVVAFESQTQALFSSINSLRSQIAAKNVEISSMSSYARKDNPRLKLAQSQLDAMNKELQRLERDQQLVDTGRNSRLISGDALTSIGQFPELSIEYQKYVRALQFATAKYETMLRQYENARLSEASDLTTIFILDRASVPSIPAGPARRRMIILGTGAGFAITAFFVFLMDHINEIKKERRRKRKHYDEDEDDDD